MREVVIKSSDKRVLMDADILKIKAKFIDLGFRNLPIHLLLEYCPFKKESDINKWKSRVSNIWHGRIMSDAYILSTFNKAYNKIKYE